MPQTRRRGAAEILTDSERFLTSRSNRMAAKMSAGDAKAYVDELYRKVEKRWEERVTRSQFMKELTTAHYGLTPQEAIYFSLHEEADTREHEGGIMGHGGFRRLVLQRLLEEGAEVRPGYTLEYCALTSMDLHGAILQATLQAAAREGPNGMLE